MIYGHYCRPDDSDIGEGIVGPLIDSIDLEFQSSRRSVGVHDSGGSAKTADISNEDIMSPASESEIEPEITDISERLRKVKNLLDEGLITESEAAEKRKNILDEF